ncbi:MAG: peptidyl-prolyl cis-trans isomerase [Azoarcus sp.]|jgi:peptidyl-prolyl cis-trans isomerase C|nr:peptidyl-prolyl cis-trans isomerase [Azoarcus sp.]
MKKPLLSYLLPAVLAISCAPVAFAQGTPAAQPAAAKPFVTVNNVSIPQYIADEVIAEFRSRGTPDTPDFREGIREELIGRALLIDEAKKQNLDKTPQYSRNIETAKQMLLVREAVEAYFKKNPVTDAEVQSAYDSFVSKMVKTEYKLRTIQLNTETEAKDALAKLNSGKKFDQLAKETGIAPTKEYGGDMGWKIPPSLPPVVLQALQGVAKGSYTKQAVQANNDWYIFYVEDTRPFTPPSISELYGNLVQGIRQQKLAQHVQELRKSATVK